MSLDNDDPWGKLGAAADSQEEPSQRGGMHGDEEGVDFGSPADDYEPLQDDPQVVDAEATVRRKKKLGPALVMATVAVVALGVAGMGMHGLYRKIFPAPQEVASVGEQPSYEVPVEPAKGDSSPALPQVAAASAPAAGLPGVSTGSEATTIGAAGAPQTPAAAQPAPQLASSPVAAPATPSIAAGSAPAPAAPAVAIAPAAPAAPTVATRAAPTAPVVPVAAPAVAAQPAAPANMPVEKTPERLTAGSSVHDDPAASHASPGTARKASRKRAASASAKPVRAVIAARATRQGEGVRSAARGNARSQARKAEAIPEVGLGVLTGYRIESIEPNFGQHQIAWIRGKDGRLSVVAVGDAFDGGRVLKVDGASYSVRTTQGEIR